MSVLAEIRSDERASHGISLGIPRRLGFVLVLAVATVVCRGAILQDMFTNRETVTTISGQIETNNSAATVEAGEPNHGGKTGGHSMWLSWIAPTNGVASLKTEGSGFDTLLSAYYFRSTNDLTLDKLVEAARADDSEGLERESEIEFGVLAGQRYEIAVDGYFGAAGFIELKWELLATTSAPPVVLSTTPDRSANIGDAVTLTVVLTNAGSAQFDWFFNDNELGVTTTNLFIPSMQVTNVGRYKMRIDLGNVRYFTTPTELQINTERETSALAQGKLLDSPSTPLIGQSGPNSLVLRNSPVFGPTGGFRSLDAGVARGYNGSQVFNTTFATVDPAEPPHCGVSNGVSYWLAYQPPSSGTVTLDTIGSTFDTVMEVYTYNGALSNFQNLISLGCNNDTAGLNGASRLVVPVFNTRPYIVAVEGVNGARGTAWINYSLNTNQLPQPPSLLSPTTNLVVATGLDVSLSPSITGSPPLKFSWKKNTSPIPGQTTPTLFLPGVTTNDTASYVATVTNDLGTLDATLPLKVVIPTLSVLAPIKGGLTMSFPTIAGQRYTVEEATNLPGPWQPWPNFYIGDGQAVVANVPNNGTRFYRVRIE